VLRLGRKLYYRHTIPVDAQGLLKRVEIWRSLGTDSFAVATRRLPAAVARISIEIEHARASRHGPEFVDAEDRACLTRSPLKKKYGSSAIARDKNGDQHEQEGHKHKRAHRDCDGENPLQETIAGRVQIESPRNLWLVCGRFTRE
jgi:hypothetical protein